MTHLEQLTDLRIRQATGVSLLEWIAYWRQPGENWHNWEALARKQYETTGSWVHRPSLRTWAETAGLPETRDPGKRGTVEDTLNYRKVVKATTGITVPPYEPVIQSGAISAAAPGSHLDAVDE